MKATKKAPTMADVARAAGVSPMTVSRAFKSDAYVNDNTRETIIKAADRLGYVLDSTAAGLSSRKTGFVAVIIPSINNANFADTVRGLTDGLRESRLQVLLGYTAYQIEEEERLVRQLLTRRPEALVVTGGYHSDACRRMLENSGIPIIETWDLPANPIGHSIGFSNFESARMLVRHLISIGRKNIAFLGGDADGDNRGSDRRRGFIHELEQQGLSTERLSKAGKPPISMREGAVAFGKLIEQWPDIDALVCVSDLAAFGALSECQRRGINVPEQIALCGFGNYEISDICVPPVTTIDPHCYRIGEMTAKTINQLLSSDEDQDIASKQSLEPKLIIRASTVGE